MKTTKIHQYVLGGLVAAKLVEIVLVHIRYIILDGCTLLDKMHYKSKIDCHVFDVLIWAKLDRY